MKALILLLLVQTASAEECNLARSEFYRGWRDFPTDCGQPVDQSTISRLRERCLLLQAMRRYETLKGPDPMWGSAEAECLSLEFGAPLERR